MPYRERKDDGLHINNEQTKRKPDVVIATRCSQDSVIAVNN